MNIIKVNCLPLSIFVGYERENDARGVTFDYSAWAEQYGDGVLQLLVQRPGDADPYPVVLTAGENNTAVWLLSATDTAVKGWLEIQLIFTVGSVVAKTAVLPVLVDRSLAAGATPPDPYETWLETLTELAAQILHTTQPPEIRDGYWYIFDPDTGEYVNSGVKAEGEDGVGITGAQLNADYTLTLSFSDGTSYTTPSIRGAQGPRGEQGPAPTAQQISAAADTWLGQNIAQETGYVLDRSLTMQNAPAPSSMVGDLRNSIKNITEIAIKSETEPWFSGNMLEAWTSSTFSGFATSWENNTPKLVDGIIVWVRSRASSNITQMKVRIENDAGTFVYEQIFDVEVGAARQQIELPVSCQIPAGLIWVAVAANQIATFEHDTAQGQGYQYWTDGNFNLSNLKQPGGATHRLAMRVSYLTGIKIADGSISQKTLSFAEMIEPENLINIDDPDQCKKGWWYYSTNIGEIISPQDVSAYNYTALKALSYGATVITFGTFPEMTYPPNIYWIGAADENMVLLSYSLVNTAMPVTYTMPEGAVYVLASLRSKSDDVLSKLMCVKGTEITKYVKGSGEKYLLKQCEVESDEDEGAPVTLKLPDSYDLVVGDTFQLFKKGIVDATNPELYDVRFSCLKGNAFERFFEYTPEEAGQIDLSVLLYGEGHKVLDSKKINLTVRAKASSPISTKCVLCVGDSLTTGGSWPQELNRRLVGSGGSPEGDELNNVQFIGTRNYNGTHYEGYGGWSFQSYNTPNISDNAKLITCVHDKVEAQDQHSIYKDTNNAQWKLETIEPGQIKIIAVSGDFGAFPSSGTLTWVSGGVNHANIAYTASQNAPGNPFWDSTEGKVDFAKYCEGLGAPQIDYVFVLLGWNDAAIGENQYKEKAQIFIDNVHASYPNAKIILMGLEIPARDGLGANYGATGTYSDYYGLMQYVFNLDQWYEDLATSNQNVLHINIAGQFDTEYNMPTLQVRVNTRNPEMVKRQSNGVHPANPGYMQIADAAYRCITALLQ